MNKQAAIKVAQEEIDWLADNVRPSLKGKKVTEIEETKYPLEVAIYLDEDDVPLIATGLIACKIKNAK